MNTLLLGSKSLSRQMLLNDMGIRFLLVDQHADEIVNSAGLSFRQTLEAIAVQKMEHVMLPTANNGEVAFVITADTMGQDRLGVSHGKPADRADAIAKIKALRGSGIVGTVFCLDKKLFDGNQWLVEKRILCYVDARYEFDMPDSWIERYLEHTPNYLQISGALTVESYGAQFLKSIRGSYTTILGLPVFELRQALEQINFF